MWSIVAIACSLTSIDDCRAIRFSMLGAATQRECRFQGITLTNDWGKQNRGWFIRRWDCDRTEFR